VSEKLAWGHPGVQSWYKNRRGKVVQNSPFSLEEYWARTHDLDVSDYTFA
jgi:4-hydroxyacetophenone monooxygenase